MPSKEEISLWINLFSLPIILLTILFIIFPSFRKLVIKWLAKKFLSEKERSRIGIDKSIRNSKNIDDKSANFGKIGKIDSFHQGDVIINLNGSRRKTKEKNDDKLKTSEKSINSITEEKLQLASELTKEEEKVLKELLKKLKKETKKEEKD